jgi:Protein kinase domain
VSSDSGIGLPGGGDDGGAEDEVPPASGDFAAGAQVAGYRLGEQVGWGGMAAVYRAYDVRLGRWVALKILAPEIASDTSFRQRFIRESRAAAAVDHPHIIPVYEAGDARGVLFIAMRYVGGGDIGTLVRRLGRLDAARTGSIVSQVGSALDAAHSAGLVHRDVKPANMLLAAAAGGGYPDHVYLSDFGLSKQVLSAAGPTITGQSLGTLDYMAPEQIEARPVDGRADLYALACTAYEMLAGRLPFRREEDFALLLAQLAETPPPLTLLRPDLPPAIDRVLVRALAKSPDDRYETCNDFAVALLHACGLEWGAGGQLLAGQPGAATRRPAALAAPGAAITRRRADETAVIDDDAAEPRWSAAPLPPAAPMLTGAAGLSGRAGRPTAAAGLAALALAPDLPDEPGDPRPGDGGPGPGPNEHGPYGPERHSPAARGLSPVITAAVLVVILAIVGAAFLTLRGSGVLHSGQAGRALPSVATRPASPGHTSHPSNAGGQSSPSRANGPVSSGSPRIARSQGGRGDAAKPAGPAATVSAYIAAINKHHYGKAWKLGGRNSSATFTAFVQGFGTTSKDTLIILSVRDNVASVELVAEQTDGTVKTYQGTYTVDDGVITGSHIEQIS